MVASADDPEAPLGDALAAFLRELADYAGIREDDVVVYVDHDKWPGLASVIVAEVGPVVRGRRSGEVRGGRAMPEIVYMGLRIRALPRGVRPGKETVGGNR